MVQLFVVRVLVKVVENKIEYCKVLNEIMYMYSDF